MKFFKELFNIMRIMGQVSYNVIAIMLNSFGKAGREKNFIAGVVKNGEVDESTNKQISRSQFHSKPPQSDQSQLTSGFVPLFFPLGASLMFSDSLTRFVRSPSGLDAQNGIFPPGRDSFKQL